MLQLIYLVMMALCLIPWAHASDIGQSNQETLENASLSQTPIIFSPTIQGFTQATQRSDGAVVATGRVEGTGIIYAENVIIEDSLSPGHSPGCISFSGNVTLSVTSTLVTEIGGYTVCTKFDHIDVANQLTINSATLEVVLINGFEPVYRDRFDIMDWGSISGTFGTIDASAATLSYPLIWDTTQLYLTGELIVDVEHIADGDLAPWNAPDGQVNAADVLIATQLTLGMRTPGAFQYAHGDMNLDDVIDIADLLLIQQTVLK